jgi:signal transduction histidine kinase
MPDQPQTFTPGARRVLKLAQEEAERQHRKVIDTQHLLLALLRENEGVVGDFLRALGLDAKQVEALVRKTRSRWPPATTQAMFNALLILDENGNLLVSNQRTQEMIDYHQAEFLDGLKRSINNTTEVTIGDRTYLALSGRLSDLGTIVFMQDITRIKKREHAAAELINNLSHELKTPLTGIRLLATLIQAVTTLSLARRLWLIIRRRRSKSQRYYAEQIISMTDRMSETTDRMSEMIGQTDWMFNLVAQADVTNSAQHRRACDLKGLVDKAIADLHSAASKKSVQVQFDFPHDGCQIMGNENYVYLMILNLVRNAIKYSPDGKEVKIVLICDATGIQLRVQDQGPGIPQDEMPHIFDKFFVGKSLIGGPSTGLGLSIVKAVAEADGGKVEAKNIPEGGAEFVVTLPASMALPPDA